MLGPRWKCIYVILVAVLVSTVQLAPWKNRLMILREGGDGPPNLVLLHGYASSAEHWIPFTRWIDFPWYGRFLFPQGPQRAVRTDGVTDGRAWWPLDLASYRSSGRDADLSRENPRDLELAAQLVVSLLDEEGNSFHNPFILGGFSQGAMVACQVAFASNEPLKALIILSGTPINETAWRSRMVRRTGLPVFISHGREDAILSFHAAERLKSEMESAGLRVTFVPFKGGHEIPTEVILSLNKFLSRLPLDKE